MEEEEKGKRGGEERKREGAQREGFGLPLCKNSCGRSCVEIS